MGLILSIDVGTTNLKAALVDEEGAILGEVQHAADGHRGRRLRARRARSGEARRRAAGHLPARRRQSRPRRRAAVAHLVPVRAGAGRCRRPAAHPHLDLRRHDGAGAPSAVPRRHRRRRRDGPAHRMPADLPVPDQPPALARFARSGARPTRRSRPRLQVVPDARADRRVRDRLQHRELARLPRHRRPLGPGDHRDRRLRRRAVPARARRLRRRRAAGTRRSAPSSGCSRAPPSRPASTTARRWRRR